MGKRTGIAWTTSTFNPWVGCTEVSPGCDNCYAHALDKRHKWGGATHWGAGVPRYRTKNWTAPLAWNKKAAATGQRWTVFPSLCDPFDNEVPKDWRFELWTVIRETPSLTWLLLTKRIGNALNMIPADWVTRYPNVWLGSSVVNQEEADRDIPKLLATPAAKRFVSYEPALGPVDWTKIKGFPPDYFGRLSWLIIGGESSQGGAKARPFDLAWARSTVNQCKAAGVPVFVKQIGSYTTDLDRLEAQPNLPGDTIVGEPTDAQLDRLIYLIEKGHFHHKDRAGADPAEWPADLRVQEFP